MQKSLVAAAMLLLCVQAGAQSLRSEQASAKNSIESRPDRMRSEERMTRLHWRTRKRLRRNGRVQGWDVFRRGSKQRVHDN